MPYRHSASLAELAELAEEADLARLAASAAPDSQPRRAWLGRAWGMAGGGLMGVWGGLGGLGAMGAMGAAQAATAQRSGASPAARLPAAVKLPMAYSRWFTTSDGVRLHYLDTGPPPAPADAASPWAGAPALALVPGWCMPSWVWQAQLAYFARFMRVVALDPRGQGLSDVPVHGYEAARRAADIGDWLLAAQVDGRVVLAGWSLGVLEVLHYLHDARLQGGPGGPGDVVGGVVLVDNSLGVGDVPTGGGGFTARPGSTRSQAMAGFVAWMFRRPPDRRWLQTITDAALRMPRASAAALLRPTQPRSFYAQALLATTAPVLFAARPHYGAQAAEVAAQMPRFETELYPRAGHALFADEAEAFNARLQRFVVQRVLANGNAEPQQR